MTGTLARVMIVSVYLLSAQSAFAQQYTVTDLGTLGGNFSTAYAINARGQVVGASGSLGSYPPTHAFLWSDGAMQDLGLLPGKEWSWATAITDSGHIVGYSGDIAGDQAFLWTAETGLIALPIPSRDARALGINALDHIVGWRAPSPNEAFLYRDGVIESLGPFTAYGINDDDHVVGKGPGVARLWDADGPHDLDDEGGSSAAYAISADGLVIAGESSRGGPDYPRHAVLWTPYGISDLGTLPGGNEAQARAMSGTLIVGGSSTTPLGDAWHAFVYDTNGPGYAVDLNDLIPSDSGWVLREAMGINSAGQIVGDGSVNGEEHAFLLTPVQAIRTPH